MICWICWVSVLDLLGGRVGVFHLFEFVWIYWRFAESVDYRYLIYSVGGWESRNLFWLFLLNLLTICWICWVSVLDLLGGRVGVFHLFEFILSMTCISILLQTPEYLLIYPCTRWVGGRLFFSLFSADLPFRLGCIPFYTDCIAFYTDRILCIVFIVCIAVYGILRFGLDPDSFSMDTVPGNPHQPGNANGNL